MDVILLSRMVGELMPGLDSLSLPGLGTFTAEQVGASFSDKGYTINPPYRRLSFTGTQTDDGRLAGLYASSNGVSQEEADTILRAFTASLSKELSAHSSIELPGLGRLRSTREGHLFFVPDEDLDISPEACGLTSVSLKFHSVTLPPLPDLSQPAVADKNTAFSNYRMASDDTEAADIDREASETGTSDDTKAVASGREASEAGTAAEGIGPYELTSAAVPDGDAVGGNSKVAPEGKTGEAVRRNRKKNSNVRNPRRKPSKAFYFVAAPILAAALIIGGFAALSRVAPSFTDKLLYTPEQLAIINTPEWN